MSRLSIHELERLARKALTENGFAVDFPSQLIDESSEEDSISNLVDAGVKDLRSLLWSSIDNRESRDLDQVEYAEKMPGGAVRLLVGIADVDAFVPKDSPIDGFAAHNTVSIYAANLVFPMLPERLSTDLTSLLPDRDRLAIVVEMIVAGNGDVKTDNIFRAIVRNRAKLSYEEIGVWLGGNNAAPASVADVAGLEAQIRLQQETARRLYRLRRQKGALEFETIESKAVYKDGEIVGLKAERGNAARDIIENFMVTANVETAEFLERRNALSFRRVVKTPDRWNRIVEVARSFGEFLPENPDSVALAEFLTRRRQIDPAHYPDISLSVIKLLGAGEYVAQIGNEASAGHFGLAVADYAHSTAPNRRYADLIVQRLIKAETMNAPAPYTFEELSEIAARCNERESAARKVERQMRKTVAASVMSERVGETFDAIVTGATARGTFARTLDPPVDGRIVEGEDGLEVGEKVRVRLNGVDVRLGFIDFALASSASQNRK